MTIAMDSIRAVSIDDGRILCKECFGSDFSKTKQDEIITKHEIAKSDDLVYCDECGELIEE